MIPSLPSICICTVIDISGDTLLLAPHSVTYARLVGPQFNFKTNHVQRDNLKIGDVVYLSITLTRSDANADPPVTMLAKYDKNQSVNLPHTVIVASNDEPSDVDTIIDPPN
jgi:hypothetical protein